MAIFVPEYMIDASGTVKHVADYVSVATVLGDTLYCIGTEQESDWSGAPKTWKAFTCKGGVKSPLDIFVEGNPYGICAMGGNAFLIGDAGDYFNPGTVSLYKNGRKAWTVDAGVIPGHFAIW